MSLSARVRDLFVEPSSSAPGPSVAPVRSAAAVPPPSVAPIVAVLCRPTGGRVAVERIATAGVALALARASGEPFACAGAAAVAGRLSSSACVPAAGRAAGRLREQGLHAAARGRLLWVADRRIGADRAALAAAVSAEIGRAAYACGVPAAVAIPLPRTAALDRVLAWFDGIVVVTPPRETTVADGGASSGEPDPMLDRALASLAELGRPVVAMAAPARLEGMLAAAGMRPPPEALDAVAKLGLGRLERRGG